MAVVLFVSETLAAAANASDTLQGGGTGVDLGQVQNGLFAPIVDQSTNNGAQILWIRHDSVVDPITNLKVYLSQYTATGFTYGGNKTPATDFSETLAEGAASAVDAAAKNNSSGGAGGLWMDQKWDVTQTNQFDISTRSAEVKIFGRAGQGQDAATAFTLDAAAMLHTPDNAAENDASAPVAGSIGISTDTVLGNRAKLRFRIYLRSAFPDGGYVQVGKTYRYSFTA
jgi:hypothetical protein